MEPPQGGVSGLRRKDTTKGPPLRVLSLDGGGVRGYSMLIILQELMHRTFVETEGRAPKRDEIPKPCDHFDLIAGTGTGGLIALMLGRMRMDLETCKDVYVRMTKRVFETDKTFAGIPYRSTLFKASKLEEAIRECVREHTISENEGNDFSTESMVDVRSSGSSVHRPQRSSSQSSRYSQIGMTPINGRHPMAAMRWGNPNALLYDARDNRTKTAVTAVYKGTPKGGNSIFLRSYDSRKESAPEFNCTIWQAGRATSATGLAFKPIQIGQSMFIDEGAGTYNPAPQVLDEAVCNEWPGREVGVFVSIGTGKRPKGTGTQQHLWWEGFVSSGIGDFAEARRRLIAKIEGCEDIHQFMLTDYLGKRGVNPENYIRLNVEVGVGEFGMNEWARLAEISTNTRRYLSRDEVKSMTYSASSKLGRIYFAKLRHERQGKGEPLIWDHPAYRNNKTFEVPPPSNPIAVELPAEDVVQPAGHPTNLLSPSQAHQRRPSAAEEKIVYAPEEYPSSIASSIISPISQRHSGNYDGPYRRSGEFIPTNPHSSQGSLAPSPRRSGEEQHMPPPLPPKTPIQDGQTSATLPRPPVGIMLPYPDTDGPPPVVNMARKPEISR